MPRTSLADRPAAEAAAIGAMQTGELQRAGTLFLIRHGRTRGNGQHYVGWEDLELDATGLTQVDQLGQAMAAVHLDAIYCSPLIRARQTAQALIRFGQTPQRQQLRPQERPELMEIHYGEFQGFSKAEHSLRLRRDYTTRRLPGGESLADVHTRVERFAPELTAHLLRREVIAVVAHYRSLQLLRGAIVGESLEAALARRDYKPGNGSILCMQFTIEAAAMQLQLVETLGCASFDPRIGVAAELEVSPSQSCAGNQSLLAAPMLA